MPKITKLQFQKNGKIVNVFIDGKFSFGLTPDYIVKNNLKPNTALSFQKIDEIFFQSQYEKLLSRALNFLSFRPRSKKEIKDHLSKMLYKYGIETESKQKISEKIIKKLEEQKLIDDLEFSRWWIEQRLTHRPKSKKIIYFELRSKGIDREIINKLITKNIDEVSLINKIIEKKLRSFRNLSKQDIRRKLFNYLVQRGFEISAVHRAIDEILQK